MPNTVAPKLDPVRRNARSGPLVLPSAGRPGPVPRWPLAPAMSADERIVWRDLWRTPHAVAWERLGWTRSVARYCRVLVDAERPGADCRVLAEARQLEDRLGLTPRAMRNLLWQIAPDEVAEKRDDRGEDDLTRRRRLAGRRSAG